MTSPPCTAWVMPENAGKIPVVPLAQPSSLGESEGLQVLGDDPAVCCSAVILKLNAALSKAPTFPLRSGKSVAA